MKDSGDKIFDIWEKIEKYFYDELELTARREFGLLRNVRLKFNMTDEFKKITREFFKERKIK